MSRTIHAAHIFMGANADRAVIEIGETVEYLTFEELDRLIETATECRRKIAEPLKVAA